MHYGFKIVQDMNDGLSNWMDSKSFATIDEVVGKSLHRVSDFKDFNLSFRAVAQINQEKCIKCNLCYVACNDTAHLCIDMIDKQGAIVVPHSYDVTSNGKQTAIETRPSVFVREADCVGCRLCFNVCPVDHCIEMVELPSGRAPATWDQICTTHPEVTQDWDKMKEYRDKMDIHIH